MIPPRRRVETRARRLCAHWMRGFLQRNENTDLRLLAVNHASEVSHVRWTRVPSFHRDNHLLRLAALVIVEKEPAIDAFVRAFLLISWSRSDEAQCPPLESVGVFSSERSCVG